MVRKLSQFSCKKRHFISYGYGEEPENMNFKGSKPRRHLGVIYVWLLLYGYSVLRVSNTASSVLWGKVELEHFRYWKVPGNSGTAGSCTAPCGSCLQKGSHHGAQILCAPVQLRAGAVECVDSIVSVNGDRSIPGTALNAWSNCSHHMQPTASMRGHPSVAHTGTHGVCTCTGWCLQTRSSGPG